VDLQTLARNWWVVLLRGIAGVLLIDRLIGVQPKAEIVRRLARVLG
jgi:hypothetical protein